MKSIIIFGEPRCGKSTLANMIVEKFHYQVIRVDAIRDTFKTIYPELKIAPNSAIKNSKFQLFIKEYLKRNVDNEERNKFGYVIEGCETSVSDCNKLFKNKNNIIYYLASTNISPIELFNSIRKFDCDKDWTYQLTDQELLEVTTKIIKNGEKIKKECKKYNINFIDTSHNRKEILESILDDIEKNINC